jgi:hypothetical protein
MDKHGKRQYHWVNKTKRKRTKEFFTIERCNIPLDYYDRNEAFFFELLHPQSDLLKFDIPFDYDELEL